MIIDEEAYLEHYGVKGMKWGVRREAKRDFKAAKKIHKKGGKGSRARYSETKAEIERKSKKDPAYAKAIRRQRRNSKYKMSTADKASSVVAGAYVAGLGALYVAQSPTIRNNTKKAAIAIATQAGKAYRRIGESEVQRFMREKPNFYTPKPGTNIIDILPRQGLALI